MTLRLFLATVTVFVQKKTQIPSKVTRDYSNDFAFKGQASIFSRRLPPTPPPPSSFTDSGKACSAHGEESWAPAWPGPCPAT